jgi:antitoxin (DNA-binding transcriptional repressor) of toxin-antitoxin stability system
MRRRIVSATEVRTHLGEALRSLEQEELVIEKGGVPVAMLVKYRPPAVATSREEAYEQALTKRAEPAGWERMDAAMAAGWAGIEPDELTANIYRWRAEGGTARRYSFDDGDVDAAAEVTDARDVPARQRRLHPRRATKHRVADGDGPTYQA